MPLRPPGVYRHQTAGYTGTAGPGKKLLDDMLGGRVVALTERMVTDAALRIDKIIGGPIVVLERPPDCVIVVNRHGEIDL